MADATLRVFRGDREGGQAVDYQVPMTEGMVVLDAIHYDPGAPVARFGGALELQSGKCGSCSAEVNGKPRLMCKTRMDSLPPISRSPCSPMKAFPVIKDLVTDVSWNYKVNRRFRRSSRGRARMEDRPARLDRVQEFRKCIECFLCQDVCHVLRDHDKKEQFGGPRFFVRAAGLEMHPLDGESGRTL